MASFQSRDTPTHQLILGQINVRLAQIDAINKATGGAYDDVCKLYKDISFFGASSRRHEDEARNALAHHETSAAAEHQSEAGTWEAQLEVLEHEWTLYTMLKNWSEMAEGWVIEVRKDMYKLNSKFYPLLEQLTTQKKCIQGLHEKMTQTKCEMDVLTYELEACSIEFEHDDQTKKSRLEESLGMPIVSIKSRAMFSSVIHTDTS